MTAFDRISTNKWEISFPENWLDKSQEDQLYFESPEGNKWFYVVLWEMFEQETRSSSELAETFLEIELEQYQSHEDWEILTKSVQEAQNGVTAFWEALNQTSNYRVSGKILAKNRNVLRSTFHDYECSDTTRSRELLAPIISSLNWREA